MNKKLFDKSVTTNKHKTPLKLKKMQQSPSNRNSFRKKFGSVTNDTDKSRLTSIGSVQVKSHDLNQIQTLSFD
jgi:hypothetical protein